MRPVRDVFCALLAMVLLGFQSAAAGSTAAVSRGVGSAVHGSPAPNAVQVENALPGDQAGMTADSAGGGAIEGYASEVSALPGDTLHFHVSTNPSALYRVEVYRLGWYGGAGARLIGCTPSCSGAQRGNPLPAPKPDANGVVRAGWPVTDTFVLPADATSGYYRLRFVLLNGQAVSTFVIVRAPAGRRSAIVVQVPVNTWQAYNSWGGNSLYDVPGAAVRGNRVSFDRPYAWSAPMNQNPRGWEFPLVLYLEQSGYDVSYQTDLDTDSDPASLLEHRLVIDIGHDEYWTQAMRQGFETARDAGVNLAFIGANDAYWRIRYEDGGRTIVVYKSRDDRDPIADPQLQTGLFRVMDRPECELIGIQHEGGLLNWQPGDFAVVPSSLDHPWFEDTGFDAASTLPGLVSIETDTIPGFQSADSSCGHQLTVFFHHEAGGDQLGNADTTAYTAPSGAIVFASGSKRFSWGLADPPAISGRTHGLVDPRLQRFVHNMLDDLSSWRIADLGLTLTTQTSKIRRGKPVKILAVISNQGPDDATDGALDLTLPTGMTFVRVASTGLRCTRAPLHCTIAPLPPGSTVQAVFTLRLVAPGPHQLSARALAIGGTDPDVARSQAQLVISPSQS